MEKQIIMIQIFSPFDYSPSDDLFDRAVSRITTTLNSRTISPEVWSRHGNIQIAHEI
jgi:hypothetical protein